MIARYVSTDTVFVCVELVYRQIVRYGSPLLSVSPVAKGVVFLSTIFLA